MSALKRKIEHAELHNPPKVAKTDTPELDPFDDKAEDADNDEEDDDEEDEDMDDDGYEEDDFLVREEEEENNVDDSSVESKEVKPAKPKKRKLKKNTGGLMLDEDDKLLIADTLKISQPSKFDRSFQEDNEIVPTDLGDESDVDDFIEDDSKSPTADPSKSKRRPNKLFTSRRDGPTYDQIQEAREIFGDGYEDESLDELHQDDTETAENERLLCHGNATSFEYVQLVQNFCLDEDEEIRSKDEPERLQIHSHTNRQVSNLADFKEESVWIAEQLNVGLDLAVLALSVDTVLRLLLIDRFEVPFIWLYRRDYFSTALRREHLWKIFWLDARWWEIQQKREKLFHRCEKLQQIVDASDQRAVFALQQFPINQYFRFLDSRKTLIAIQDANSYFTLLCEGYGINLNRRQGEGLDTEAKRENFKASKYKKYKNLRSVQSFASLICSDAHEIGFALLHSSSATIPVVNRLWEEEAADLVALGEIPSNSHLMGAATVIVATEICHEPIIRSFARSIFRTRGSISTRPTVRGKSEITPFSQYFGIHVIENRPIDLFFNKEGLLLFMTMVEAESAGLIEIIVNPPQKKEGDKFVADLNPFFAEKLRLFQFFMPPVPADRDTNPKLRFSWDIVRLNVLQATVEKFLIPFLKADIRSELIQQGKEIVLDEVCKEFDRRLAIGPCGKYFEEPRDFIAGALLSCPDRFVFSKVTAIYVTQEQTPGIHLVTVDSNGVLIGHQIVSPQSMGQRKDKIKAFLYEHRPDLIVINSGGLAISRDIFQLVQKSILQEISETAELDRQLKKSQIEFEDGDEDGDEESAKYSPNIIMIEDTVPNILKNSGRKDVLFPDLPTDTAAALSLARFSQEPLSEYCNIWRSVDSSYLFGYEILYIKFHPLQKFVLKEKLVERLLCCLVNAVCDIGVDINKVIKFEHHANLLAFVAGLGFRKAESLRRQIQRSVGHVETREALLTHKFLGRTVWNNCCGFIKVRNKSGIENPLDYTRIHPECYIVNEFAQKICGDALDVKESNPSKYSEIVIKLMKSVRQDLEKRISKFPEWLDLWTQGKPEYFVETASSHMQLNSSRISVELQDCLYTLILDEYLQELERRGKGKRRIQFEQMKDELRFPWVDLRKPMQTISSAELFDIIYGESCHSLYVGLKVGFTVLETQDQTFYDGKDNNLRRRQRATVKIDSGVKGYISSSEIADNDYEFNVTALFDQIKVGDHYVGTVISVWKEKFYVELSLKPSVVERSEAWWLENRNNDLRAKKFWEQQNKNPAALFDHYFNEREALRIVTVEEQKRLQNQTRNYFHSINSTKKISGAGEQFSPQTRVIYHPLFANLDFRGAEEKLRSDKKGAGAVIIRPSSKGPNYLALTWAFQEDWFKHINIEELGKRPNDLGLGSKLLIRENKLTYEFSDLDELYAMYVEPLNDLVSTMVKHRNFRSGPMEDVEKEMRQELQNQPGRIPYFIRFDYQKPGSFVLTWLKPNTGKSPQVKTLRLEVTPKGFQVGNEVFARPSEVILWFKKMNDRNH